MKIYHIFIKSIPLVSLFPYVNVLFGGGEASLVLIHKNSKGCKYSSVSCSVYCYMKFFHCIL